jgi:hypothetical protein
MTVGEDKAYDVAEHVANLREMNVTPHVALQERQLQPAPERHRWAIKPARR